MNLQICSFSQLEHWSEIGNDGKDFKLISRNYSNEIVQQSQRVTPRTSIHHEFNNLRGSMSSSTSSIQNNMVCLSFDDIFIVFRNDLFVI